MLVFNSTGVFWGLMNSLLFLKCGLVSESLFFVCFIVTRAQYVNVQFSIHLDSGLALVKLRIEKFQCWINNINNIN